MLHQGISVGLAFAPQAVAAAKLRWIGVRKQFGDRETALKVQFHVVVPPALHSSKSAASEIVQASQTLTYFAFRFVCALVEHQCRFETTASFWSIVQKAATTSDPAAALANVRSNKRVRLTP